MPEGIHVEQVKCPACDGSGRVLSSGGGTCNPVYVACATCNGTGRVSKEFK